MPELQKVTVVIPSLDPDDRLPAVIRGVQEKGFTDILLVDDGSAEQNQHYFQAAEHEMGCTVLHHTKNLGKGRALKTAFQWLLENRPDAAGCVTIDGDGQHHADDILACTEEMLSQEQDAIVLGARDFKTDNMPAKSRFGNKCTAAVFKLFCGMAVTDTQTGLRVFPRSVWKQMLEISGERFEYETNMLLMCGQQKIRMTEHPIRTIYIDSNASTHFHPIKDSARIYGIILRYFRGSLISYAVEFITFILLNGFLKQCGFAQHLFLACALGGIAGLVFGFLFNRREMFRSTAPRATVAARHCILWAFRMFASFLLILLVTKPFGDSVPAQDLFKFLVDFLLCFGSFRIKQAWIFRTEPEV